jgi:DNA-binding NarL/FixJ family response regulator
MPDTMSPDQIALAIEESEPPLKHSTVVIADRHALYREALANMLDAQGDFRVVGQATNPTNTLNACAEIRPDIMVLDIELLGSRSQVESLARFISASPSTCILVVTMLDDPDLVNEVLNLGVRGYLHKTATGMEIVTALVAIRSNRESSTHNGGRSDEQQADRDPAAHHRRYCQAAYAQHLRETARGLPHRRGE